jgi:DNA polymerase-3 subunit gamma/tau
LRSFSGRVMCRDIQAAGCPCDGVPRTMSGGEPSSIKRISLCAAESVRSLYVREHYLIFLSEGSAVFQALYRKWRPRVFEDVVGQPQITSTLLNELRTGCVGHAYLFTGSRGTGKTTCAKILAKAVNCLDPHDGDPCNACDICRGIDSGAVLDVVEIDAASNNGVDNIRDLREETAFSPAAAKYRVYIIDEAHMLSGGAFNALLKTLEEPPAYVIFILATTEVHKIPATILSRCQRFDFRRIPAEDIAARLAFVAGKENIALTPEAALLIARIADGGMRDALSLLEKCSGLGGEVNESAVARAAGLSDRKYLHGIAEAASKGDFASAIDILDRLYGQSKDMELLCEELIDHFRGLMLIKSSRGAEKLLTNPPDEVKALNEESAFFTLEAVLHILDTLARTLDTLRRSAAPRVEMEMCLLRLCRPEFDDSPDALLRRLASLESRLGAGARIMAVPAAAAAAKRADKPVVSDAEPADRTAPETASLPEAPARDASGMPDSSSAEFADASAADLTDTDVPASPEAADTDDNAPAENTAVPDSPTASKVAASAEPSDASDEPLDCWPEVLGHLAALDPPLGGVLRGSTAVRHGGFVLIDSSNALFAELIRKAERQKPLIEAVRRVTGTQYKVGIRRKALDLRKAAGDPLDELIKNASDSGVSINER